MDTKTSANQNPAPPVKSSRAIELLRRTQKEAGVKIVPDNDPPATPPPVIDSKPKEVEPKANEEEYKFDLVEDSNKPVEQDKKDVAPHTDKAGDVEKKNIPAEYVPEDPTDEVDQLIDPKDTTGANFKKLRTKLKSVTKERAELNTELTGLRKKVQEYENGEIIPGTLQSLHDRIAYLEQFEQLHNFKGSPYYQEKIIKPLQEESNNLQELVKGYNGVTVEAVEAALNAPTEADKNRQLMGLFRDEVGVLEAKAIQKRISKIKEAAVDAEKQPAQTLARMQVDNDAILNERKQKANERIVHSSKEGWKESLVSLREDTRFAEITFKEGDTEHNETYVRPILTKAAQEYGRTIKILAQHGLTELPKELALKLARSDQLAHYSAVLMHQRDTLQARVAELERLLHNKHRINRPSLTGSSGGNGGSSGSGKPSGSAGQRALERVGYTGR